MGAGGRQARRSQLRRLLISKPRLRPACSVSGEAKPVVTVDRGWFTSDIYINGELAKAATCAPTFRWRRVLRTARSKAGCCPSCGSEWGQPSPTLMALAALAMAMVAVAVTERQRGFNLLVWKS